MSSDPADWFFERDPEIPRRRHTGQSHATIALEEMLPGHTTAARPPLRVSDAEIEAIVDGLFAGRAALASIKEK